MEVNEAKVDSLFGHQPVESDVKLEPSEQGNLLKGIDKKTVKREGQHRTTLFVKSDLCFKLK